MKPLSQLPEYKTAAAEINTLNSALVKVEGRISEIELLLNDATTFDSDKLHLDAAMRFAETGQVSGIGATPDSLREEHVLLRRQRDALKAAIVGRHAALHVLSASLSAAACKQHVAAHKALAARALAALKEFDAAVAEEQALISSIEQAGYSVSFTNHVAWPHIGTIAMKDQGAMWHHVRHLDGYANS